MARGLPQVSIERGLAGCGARSSPALLYCGNTCDRPTWFLSGSSSICQNRSSCGLPGGFFFSFGTKVPRLCFASVTVHTTTSGPRAAEEEETSVVSSPLASSHGVRPSQKKNLIVCLSCCSASRWATGRRASLRCAPACPPAPTVGQHRHRSVDLVASFPPTFVAVVFRLRVLAPSGFSRTGR